MNQKKVTLANFNVTYGDKNLPMLTYFDEIIFPAFLSSIKRVKYGDEYFFSNVALHKIPNELSDEYVLAGYFVKKTELEVFSTYEDGKLIAKDEHYPTAPYSIFVIKLSNHRMYLIRNQKGSPDIKSFNTTVRFILRRFISEYNKSKKKELHIPSPIVHIIGLPSSGSIEKELKKVSKIRSLTLSIFPLNGDLPGTYLEEQLLERLEYLGSKTGKSIANSPSNKKHIGEVIKETKGHADAKLDVIYKQGGKGTIKSNMMTETIEIAISSDSLDDIISTSYEILSDRDELTITSNDHQKIFSDNLIKLENYFK